jgi:anthranilate synthase component I
LWIVRNVFTEGKGTLQQKYDGAVKEIEHTRKQLEQPVKAEQSSAKAGNGSVVPKVESNFKKPAYLAAIKQAKQYIRAGDIFQVVISQRFSAKTQAEPFQIYRELRALNPSPYLFFLQLNDVAVVGSSPEMLVKVQGREVQYRPIAGTRWRGKDEAEDARLEKEMLADEKERAEHIMLVDLGRNDLGRVCEFGTVKVPQYMALERYSHVMHLVSTVDGKLAEGRDHLDALVACFPAGTVSGAPKIRAMQIISELEPTRRDLYAGAVGYIDFAGNLDFCIAIRTITIRDGKARVQAGAGIVADSNPAAEYEETRDKARALLTALTMAEAGL